MRISTVFAAALVLGVTLAAAATAEAQTVKIEFLMGKVNLTAQNASLRTIINEWARVGGARVINPERLAGAPVTLQLTGVPERQALEILLRDVGGYLLGPRQTDLVPGLSAYEQLMVVTAAAGPALRPAQAAPPRPAPNNAIRRPVAVPVPQPDAVVEAVPEPEADEPAQGGPPNRANIRPAVAPPQPQAEAPATTAPVARPGNPFGITGGSRPGIVTPAPQNNTTPRQPNEQ